MTTARQENARTLASLLGLDEGRADALLDATAVITATIEGERLAHDIGALLARTLSKVSYDVDPQSKPTIEVVVGTATPRTDALRIGVGVSGYGLDVRDGASALGTKALHRLVELLAAGYASAAAVHRALGLALALPLRLPIEINLADLYGSSIKRLHQRLDLGVAYLAGAGAIGNAAILGLSTLDVHGELHVCDRDNVSDGNLNRCWWFVADDRGKKKCAQLVAHAQPAMEGLRLFPRDGTLKDAFKADGEIPIETMIVAVDSRRARRSLQSEMPHRVYDASTTGIDEFVLHSNEIPSDYACMSCIYYEDALEAAHEAHVADLLGVDRVVVRATFISPEAARIIVAKYPHLELASVEGQACDTLFKQLCARGELKGGGDAERVLAPFCFVSVLAGLYLAIEVALRAHLGSAPPTYNFWRLSPWAAAVARLREQRAKRPDCEFCAKQVLEVVVSRLWGSGAKK
jgi:hypothetical protein